MYRSNRWLVVGVIAALSLAGGAIAAKTPKPPKEVLPPWEHPRRQGSIPAEWGELRSSRAGVGPVEALELTFEADDGTIRVVYVDLAAGVSQLTLVFRRTAGTSGADEVPPSGERR